MTTRDELYHQHAPGIAIRAVAGADASVLLDIYDVQSVTVSLVNTGSGTAKIVLNNERFQNAPRETAMSGQVPMAPRWKYNDLKKVFFGQRMHIDFGYAANKVLLTTVRVTNLSFAFPGSGAHSVTIEAEDLLSLLKAKPRSDKTYRDKDESEILGDLIDRSECGLALFSALPGFSQKLRSKSHRKTETYLKLMQDLVDPLDGEIWMDPDGQTINIGSARSTENNPPLELLWGRDLLEFSPKFDVWSQYTEVTAAGRQRGQDRRHENTLADSADVMDDLRHDAENPSLITAVDLRSSFGDEFYEPANPHEFQTSNLDPGRASQAAAAKIREQARKFLTATGEVIGRTDLVPGKHVRIGGLNVPFDGVYYISKADHVFDGSGYRTKFTLRRPAMFNPAEYPLRGQEGAVE